MFSRQRPIQWLKQKASPWMRESALFHAYRKVNKKKKPDWVWDQMTDEEKMIEAVERVPGVKKCLTSSCMTMLSIEVPREFCNFCLSRIPR